MKSTQYRKNFSIMATPAAVGGLSNDLNPIKEGAVLVLATAKSTQAADCLGDPGECAYNDACMYQCQGEKPTSAALPQSPRAAEPDAKESARSTAESARSTAESARSTAESARSTAESARSTAESTRSTEYKLQRDDLLAIIRECGDV